VISGRDRRRQRYAEDPEYRERIRAANRANQQLHRDELNRRRRLRYATDPVYRAKRLVPRPRHRRDAYLKARYGISLEQYELMLRRQGGVCAICGEQPAGSLYVDHCHATSKVRGLLCQRCNCGLGYYRDDQRLTMAATAYLRKASLYDEFL
jgi:hypothetical protein